MLTHSNDNISTLDMGMVVGGGGRSKSIIFLNLEIELRLN